MEKIQKLLDKSDDLLNEEVEQGQTLNNEFGILQSKYDELFGHHESNIPKF